MTCIVPSRYQIPYFRSLPSLTSASRFQTSVHLNARTLPKASAMSANSAELERLAHPEYWNERYAEVGPDEQVHEWFRSFNDLKPFFDQHIFQARGPETSPRILHLGSGDSVSSSACELLLKLIPAADDTGRFLENGLQGPNLC